MCAEFAMHVSAKLQIRGLEELLDSAVKMWRNQSVDYCLDSEKQKKY